MQKPYHPATAGNGPHRPATPKGGDRYAVETSFPAIVRTYWRAPFSGGEEMILPVGLEFLVEEDPLPEATGISALPDPAELWEVRLVPAHALGNEKYAGYGLVIGFDELARHCRRL